MKNETKHRRSDLGQTHKSGETKLLTLPKKYKRDWLGRFDKRTVIYQHLDNSYQELLADQGGEDQCSHIRKSLNQKYIWLEFMMKELENRIAQRVAENKSPGELMNSWLFAAQRLNSLAHRLGLAKRAKMVESSLSEYIGRRRKNE